MKKHAVSFLRSPIGYLANLAASILPTLPPWLDYPMTALCERFCLKDGIQDDCMF